MSTAASVAYDYNTQRPRLIIPEYGRHVQRMVEHCMGVEDRAERTRLAKAIILVIGRLNPQLRGSENADRALWDHLYIMSEFKLDVDGPFPKPTAEELDTKPERVPYPKQEIRYGHYGKLVERMIAQCAALAESPERDAYTHVIANLMKKQFLTWNRDTVPDGVILKDLAEMSKGKLKLKEEAQLASTADLLRAQQNGPRNEVDMRKQRYGNQGGGGGGGGKKRHRNRNKKRY
ncbi:MAG: DUF4290 domain-containing protein [Flavobacteriales bacterium]|nr:DUF4290 domain-containing protein [Flavobacteriales bacterium]